MFYYNNPVRYGWSMAPRDLDDNRTPSVSTHIVHDKQAARIFNSFLWFCMPQAQVDPYASIFCVSPPEQMINEVGFSYRRFEVINAWKCVWQWNPLADFLTEHLIAPIWIEKKKWKESMHFKRSYGVITDNGSAAIVHNNRYVDRKWHSIL